MILTVDIGNSRIKWASWQADKIIARGASGYSQEAAEDALDRLFSTVERPLSVYAVCVAGKDLSRILSQWVKQHWQLEVGYLKTEKRFEDIINAYDDPTQHGADRWAGIVAARKRFPGSSLCVISAGTAITFDLVAKSGQHLGGYILPSFTTMHVALMTDTANVRSTSGIQYHERGVPNNTNDAVNQGLHKLIQAGIRELCQSARSGLAEPVQIILTGGSAESILDYPDMPAMSHQPDLVMQGLYDIMKQRKS